MLAGIAALPMPVAFSKKPSNRDLFWRMLRLAWRYRWGCARLVALQLVLLTVGLGVLALTGLAVDTIRYHASSGAKPPEWPFGAHPPVAWSPTTLVMLLGAAILALASVRGVL